MRKNKPILDLNNEIINYINNYPIHVSILNVMHSSVHYHESDIELIYCLKGNVQIHCNHEDITLHEGQVFSIDYRDIHCLSSNTENCLIIFHIDMKNVSLPYDYLEYVYLGCQDFTCNKKQHSSLVKVKEMLLAASFQYFKSMDSLSSGLFKSFADKILTTLCNDFDLFNSINDEKSTSDELHERMHNIIKYCQQNYMNKITLKSLAEAVHINENYFSQFMHHSTYGSFRNMLGYIRSFESQYYLLASDYSILTIANICGFSNDKYFYKQFKQWWKKTPQEYRNWHKEFIRHPVEMYPFNNTECTNILYPYITDFFIENAFR